MTQTDDQHPDDDTIDPSADDDGRIGRRFAAEIGHGLSERLRDPDLWSSPEPSLADRIATAVASESSTGGGGSTVPDGLVAAGPIGDGLVAGGPVGERDEPTDRSDEGRGRADSTDPDGETDDGRGVAVLGSMGRLRSALLGAVAALVLVVGGIIGLSILDGPAEQQVFAADMVPTGLIEDVAAAIEVVSDDTGVRIDLRAAGLPRRSDDQFYQGWLELADGGLVTCGSFRQGGEVTLTAGVERSDVVAMTITVEETVGPDSPDQASSGQVVFKADFPSEG